MAKKKYEWKKTLLKAGKYLLMFGIPTLLEQLVTVFPQYSGVTIGTIAVALANYLKHRK